MTSYGDNTSDCVTVSRQALSGHLEQRGISVDDVDVFLEASYTPLPLSSDCYSLASRVLHVNSKSLICTTRSSRFVGSRLFVWKYRPLWRNLGSCETVCNEKVQNGVKLHLKLRKINKWSNVIFSH